MWEIVLTVDVVRRSGVERCSTCTGYQRSMQIGSRGSEMKQNVAKRKDFEAHALRHLEDLYRTAFYVADNEFEAQNIVQESYVIAYHSWHECQFSPNCRVWLFRIMAKALVNRYGPSPSLSAAMDNADETDIYLVHSPSVNQQAIDDSGHIPFSEIVEDDVKKAIRDLPNDFRLIVVLSLLEGFSYQEIADITGVHLEVVRSRLHQGRKLIRESFRSYGLRRQLQDDRRQSKEK